MQNVNNFSLFKNWFSSRGGGIKKKVARRALIKSVSLCRQKKKKVEMGDNTSPNDVEILLLSQ
jgi:hypothetical protein